VKVIGVMKFSVYLYFNILPTTSSIQVDIDLLKHYGL